MTDAYIPGVPLEGTHTDPQHLTQERFNMAFRDLFGVPKAILKLSFREHMRNLINTEYPNLRCSTARAIFEGRIPGIPKPVDPVPPSAKGQLKRALYILDVLETALYTHLEAQEAEAEAEETVSKVMRPTKVKKGTKR